MFRSRDVPPGMSDEQKGDTVQKKLFHDELSASPSPGQRQPPQQQGAEGAASSSDPAASARKRAKLMEVMAALKANIEEDDQLQPEAREHALQVTFLLLKQR